MTLERIRNDVGYDVVRILECPFCGEDLSARGAKRAEHFADCDAFEAAWRDDDSARADRSQQRGADA
jgi:hypothetical protein